MKKPTGYVVHEGASMIDGSPIVVIMTGINGKSANRKTGDMLQTWILRQDIKPTDAVKTGADASVCGDCPHRGAACYVNVGQAPVSVWNAYRRGSYPVPTAAQLAEALAGRKVRFGAYGDPAAAHVSLWQRLAGMAAGWTGYTHQWRRFPALAAFCMASADSPEDYAAAMVAGFRTFRTRLDTEGLAVGEIACPAADEGGNKTQCAKCGLCSGATGKGANGRNIAIIAHGAASKVKAYQAFRGITVAVA